MIDAGIATKDNLTKIRKLGYDYLCVSRSKLKNYQIVEGNDVLTVEDKMMIHNVNILFFFISTVIKKIVFQFSIKKLSNARHLSPPYRLPV